MFGEDNTGLFFEPKSIMIVHDLDQYRTSYTEVVDGVTIIHLGFDFNKKNEVKVIGNQIYIKVTEHQLDKYRS